MRKNPSPSWSESSGSQAVANQYPDEKGSHGRSQDDNACKVQVRDKNFDSEPEDDLEDKWHLGNAQV